MLIALAYFFVDMKDIYNFISGEVKYINSKCNLQKDICKEVLSDGSEIAFSITPENIPIMRPLEFNLKTKNINVNEIEFKIFGINMGMGLYSFKLQKESKGNYRGNGLIPSCVIDMKWEGNLIIDKNSEKVGVKFEFETDGS